MGRPSIYSEELAGEILKRMSEGEPLRQICRDEHMPHARRVHEWVTDNTEDFAQRYARACEARVETMADELMEIADGPAIDVVDVQKNRLRIDTRKWLMSKMLPKKYGDKIEHTGNVAVGLVVRSVDELEEK